MRSDDDVGSDNNGATESIFSAIGRTVRDIIGNAQEIIRSEVQLAKKEIMEELRRAAKAAAFYAAAGICALFALGLFLWAGVYALLYVVPLWLAVLIVGFLMAVIGGIAFYMAKKEVRRLSVKAEQTIAPAKENVRWAKNRFR
jgi:fatty acid desaturase